MSRGSPPARSRRWTSTAAEAARRRLRRHTDAGTDVAIDLPAGAYLADGVVLADDGARVVVVRRPPEAALVVVLDAAQDPGRLAAQAVRLGHAFGNQHVPVEVEGCEVRIPLTTSEAVARATVERLDLRGARIAVARVPLARDRARGRRPRPLTWRLARALLAALQLGDGALPVGRFVHSYGLESWLAAHPDADEDELAALVEAVVTEAVAPLDGVAVAHAHRAPDAAALAALDAAVTARKLTEPARAASEACGRRLAALASELTGDPLVAAHAAAVRAGTSAGNLAVVEGTLARALGVPLAHAVLLELRGAAAGLLSAAVRLGRLSPVRAQVRLLGLAPALAAAGARGVRRAACGHALVRAGARAPRAGAPPRGRPHVRHVTAYASSERSTAATDGQPASAIAMVSSRSRIASARRAPASPPAPRP